MFRLIKQVFITLLSFSESLTTKCVSLNNEPCMVRLTFIDLNSVELNFYRFVISLDKCNGNCDVVDDLPTKIKSNQKWNNETCQCESKKCCTRKKDYSWNPITCICENRRYLKSIIGDLVTVCDEIISVKYNM